MSNWKMVLGVLAGSVLVLVVMAFGLSKLSGGDREKVVNRVTGVEGEQRLVLGNKEAKVTVVEFSDFQCPACAAAQPLVKRLLADYDIKLVYRHMPLYEIHPNAEAGALAAEAALVQGKFVEYHDWLFDNQSVWSQEKDPTAKLVEAAKELGLDGEKFEKELKEKTYKDFVDADYAAAIGFGVNATPTFYVNGLKVRSTELEATIKTELERG